MHIPLDSEQYMCSRICIPEKQRLESIDTAFLFKTLLAVVFLEVYTYIPGSHVLRRPTVFVVP